MSLDYYFCVAGLTAASCAERLARDTGLELQSASEARLGLRLSGPGLAVWVNDDLEESTRAWAARHGVAADVEMLLTQAKQLDPAPIHRRIALVVGTALRATAGDALFHFTQGPRLELMRRDGVVRVDDDPGGFWHTFPGTLRGLGLACSFARLPGI